MTKLLRSVTNRNLLALATLTVALAPALRAQPSCSNATMKGTYVLSQTGTIVSVGPSAVVGKVTYDGQGNGAATLTQSVNGVISRQVTITGTYTVNPDCTGSKTFAGGAVNFDFMITPDGRTITFIETDPGTVGSGQANRMAGKRRQ